MHATAPVYACAEQYKRSTTDASKCADAYACAYMHSCEGKVGRNVRTVIKRITLSIGQKRTLGKQRPEIPS